MQTKSTPGNRKTIETHRFRTWKKSLNLEDQNSNKIHRVSLMRSIPKKKILTKAIN